MKKQHFAMVLAAATLMTSTFVPMTAMAADEDVNMVFAWWGNQVRNDRTQEVLDMYVEKNPNVTIDSQPASYSDYWTKMATAAAGNALPDLYQSNYTSTLRQYVESDLLEDLTPYIESGAINAENIDQSILDAGSIDGKVYAICAGVNAPALIYNKTLTDSLDLEIKNNMTVDEWMDVCREIYEKTGVRTDLAYGNATSFLPFFMRGEGFPELLSEDGWLVEDETAFEPFFAVYETGFKEGWMLDAAIYAELTVNSVEQAPLIYFSSENTESWCACNWSNQLTAFVGSAPEDMELAYSTWPSADPSLSNFLNPSMFFSVSANSEVKDTAVDLLNYLINDIDCNNVLLAERGIPAPTDVAEAIAENLGEQSKMEIEFINQVITPNSSTITPVPPSTASEIYAYADQLVERVLYGELTAEDASKELYAKGVEVTENAAKAE